jgi:formate hydrogenlyase subunit 4
MTLLAAVVVQLLHIVLMLATAPGLVGLTRVIEARLLGRIGPSVWQPYRDLMRLLRKQPVVAEGASQLFVAAPLVCFAAVAAAGFLVPSFAFGMATAPVADLLVIAGLLALSRAVLVLAAMDAGVAFGGIGASREMAYASLAEPALVLVIFVLGVLAGTTNIDGIATLLHESGLRVSLGFALISTVAVAVAETGRVPIGDSTAQAELGMTHEGMLLEYSGRHLALLDYAAALKLLLWLTLVATIYAPYGMAPAGSGPLAWGIGLAAWTGKMLVLGIGLALLETAIARMRVARVPQFLGVALLLGLLAAVLVFAAQGVT